MPGLFRLLLMLGSPRHARGRLLNLLLLARAWRTAEGRKELRCGFDSSYYLDRNHDVARSGVDPFLHYLIEGFREGRSPSANFDTGDYLERYPDVAQAGLNPLLHHVVFGIGEGRSAALAEVSPDPSNADTGETVWRDNHWPEDTPLVSVVICCFNYGAYVEEALDSVLRQTLQDCEIIVIEGGSTDTATVEKVRELERRNPPRTRFLYRDRACLVGDNRNYGISAARGRYICCLDADDRIRPVYLEAAVFLAEAYGYDIVYPSVQNFGANQRQWTAGDASFPAILAANQISTVALFRKSAWTGAGGFRDWGLGDKYVPEDWEFWIRLLGHGFRTRSIHAHLMHYRVHNAGLTATSKTDTAYQKRAIERANSELIRAFAARSQPPATRVRNPWVNLRKPADDTPGFLFALPLISLGGGEALMRTLCRALADRGYRTVMVTTGQLAAGTRDDAASFEPITPHVYSLPQLFRRSQRCWPDFIRYLLVRYNAGTMLIAGAEFVYHLLPSLRADFPALCVADQLFNDTAHLPNNRRYAAHIDVTVVPSQSLADKIVLEHGGAHERVAVIPHGVNLRGPELPGADSSLPAEARGKFVVSFFGRFSEEKGPDLFVEIARRLRDQRGIFFCMTGEGPAGERVAKLIRKYGLSGRIYAPGFVDDVRPLMQCSDVVVVPSRLDGMPLVVLEAQVMGKPVVASSVGSIPEMIEDGRSGFLCPPGDIAAFAGRILDLLGSPATRAGIAAAARQSVRARHDAEAMVAAYVDVFERTRKHRTTGA